MRTQFPLKILINIILVSGIGISLVIPFGTNLWPVCFAIVGLLLITRKKARDSLPEISSIKFEVRALLLLSIIAITIPVWSDIYHGDSVSLDSQIQLILLPFSIVVITYCRIKTEMFFVGTVIAAWAAGILSAYQYHYLGHYRASGFMNAIVFGDLAVLYTLTALIAANFFWNTNRRLFTCLSYLGAALGLYATLLSGTKGGLALILIGLYVEIYKLIFKFTKNSYFVHTIVITILAIGVLNLPANMENRILSAYQASHAWLDTGEISDGSASIRLELWSIGLNTAAQNPFDGIGKNGIKEIITHHFAETSNSSFARLTNFHNEFLIQITSKGILGLLLYLAIIIIPLIIFMRFRHSDILTIRALSQVGIILPISYFEFGLTNAVWDINDFRYVYISWIVIIISLIWLESNKTQIDNLLKN